MEVSPVLLKFGSRLHVEQFQVDGHLFMNCLPYFWQLEGDEQRGDEFDGISRISRGRDTVMYVGANPQSMQPIRVSSFAFKTLPDAPETINLFCMFAAYPVQGRWPVPASVLSMGDYVAVVRNADEFVRRLGEHLQTNKMAGGAGLVEYVDDEHDGEIGPFRKHRRFKD